MTFNKQKWSKEYYLKNKDKLLARSKKWNKENKPKMKVIRRKWRVRNQDKNRQLAKSWAKRNPKYIHHNAKLQSFKRRNAEGSFTLKEWNDLKRKYNFRCYLCGKRKKLTVDHFIPLSKGGTNYIDNIRPACLSCNCSKGSKVLTLAETERENTER